MKFRTQKRTRRKLTRDFLIGGMADNMPRSKFNKKELQKGILVEYEHTNNRKIAEEIAKDHLKENPDYYKILKKAKL